jgi:outer membrane protein
MNIKILVMFFLSIIISTSVLSKVNRGNVRKQVEPMGYLYGLGIGINQEIYKGYNYRVIPIPILGYRGEKFSVLGPFISYNAIQFSDLVITLQAAPRFQGFNESDSYIFENMADRKLSMDAGIGFIYKKNNWKIDVSSMFDVLDRSNGFEAKTNLSKVFRTGPIFFEPSVSISYLDDNNVNYYYGVNENEVNNNTYQYQGRAAVNTTIGFSVATPILLGGFTRLTLDYTWYDSSITNSPLVKDNTNFSARFLFTKFF